jgi:hypothetical protein
LEIAKTKKLNILQGFVYASTIWKMPFIFRMSYKKQGKLLICFSDTQAN